MQTANMRLSRLSSLLFLTLGIFTTQAMKKNNNINNNRPNNNNLIKSIKKNNNNNNNMMLPEFSLEADY